MVFRDWILSQSVMFSGLIHVEACVSGSFFLMLDNIPQYGSATFCLSIHLSMDVWVANGFLATVYE